MERARAVVPSFRLDTVTAPDVSTICRHLEGIPLGIELAAARVKSLPTSEIAARLGDQLSLLSSGSRTAVARHRTLRATVDWSYQLLDDAERALFDHISVCSGGCSLEAAEAIARDAGLHSAATIDVLARLVDKSLLSVDRASPNGARFRMLESLRQYGIEQLNEKGQLASARRAHARWCATLAVTSAAAFHGPEQRRALDRLDAEVDDLRSALDWLTSNGEVESALDVASALAWYWWVRGHQREGRAWLELATGLADGAGLPAARCAAALAWAGHLAADHDLRGAIAFGTGAVNAAEGDLPGEALAKLLLAGVEVRAANHDRVAELLAEALPVLESRGDNWGVAWAYNVACFDALGRGDLSTAEDACRDSLGRFRALRDGWGTGRMVHKLAVIAELRGQDDDACELYEESLTFARSLGLDEVVAVMSAQLARIVERRGDVAQSEALREEARAVLADLASMDVGGLGPTDRRGIARRRSDLARARGLFEECLSWYRQAQNIDGEAFSLSSLGALAELTGDHAEAGRVYRELLRTSEASQRWTDTATALQRLGLVAALQGAPLRAAMLAGAAAGLRRRHAVPGGPRLDVGSGHAADESGFAAAFQRAQELGDAEAVALGLATDAG